MLISLSGNAFGEAKNAVFLNIGSPTTPIHMGWNTGIGYERALNKYYSILLTGYFTPIEIAGHYDYNNEKNILLKTKIDIIAHFRYYPLNFGPINLFLDAGGGYTYFPLSTSETKINHFLILQTTVGCKLIFKYVFLQPWIGYDVSFGKINYPKDIKETDVGYHAKYGYLILGVSFGIAF
jgi:hypothetical protein